jgi:Zn-dependent M28 family amino/carboxypeptidase
MPRSKLQGIFPALCGLFLLVAVAPVRSAGPPHETSKLNGGRAFEDLKKLASFGPRPAGSPRLAEARQWIITQLQQAGANVEEDKFETATPIGQLQMTNLVVKIPGTRPDVIIVGGHYDTARIPNVQFIGANDGGSSAALLIELARVLVTQKNSNTVWLVFFDGEEAAQSWSNTDSLYGSRHFVQKLSGSGELAHVQAMILVDMIGDAHLDIYREYNSTPWLQDLVFKIARTLGYTHYFRDEEHAIQDDHIPFLNAGVSAVDLIDLDYGRDNTYWHTSQDTVENCSPTSLTIVGRVVLEAIAAIAKSPQLK